MPTPLVTQHYPHDFQVLTFIYTGAPADVPLLYADRDLVIDSITIGVKTVSTGGAGTGLLSFEVSADPSSTGGTVVAVANVDTANVAAGDTIFLDGINNSSGNVRKVSSAGTAGSASGSTQLKYINATNTSVDNIVLAGRYLILDATTATAFTGLVQIRLRSQIA